MPFGRCKGRTSEPLAWFQSYATSLPGFPTTRALPRRTQSRVLATYTSLPHIISVVLSPAVHLIGGNDTEWVRGLPPSTVPGWTLLCRAQRNNGGFRHSFRTPRPFETSGSQQHVSGDTMRLDRPLRAPVFCC